MQSFHTTLCPNCGGKQIIAALLGATVGVMTKNAPTVDSIMEKDRSKRNAQRASEARNQKQGSI